MNIKSRGMAWIDGEWDAIPDIPSLSVIGLGKLGTPIAVCLARQGFHVIGADTNQITVDMLNEGRSPIFEPGVGELLREAGTRFVATTNICGAIAGSDVSFVIVPTPSDDVGWFLLEYINAVCTEIGMVLRKKPEFHMVVIVSTVMPSAMDEHIVPLLEKISGKICGVDFGVCYSPELVALGSVIQNYLEPDFILIGESDEAAGDIVEAIYNQVTGGVPVIRMNFVNAEIAKLALNNYVTMKITFANSLARLCEKIPGANVDTVTQAIGLDHRIGTRYLTGATPFGGPCFGRDVRAMRALGRKIGGYFPLAPIIDELNREQMLHLQRLVRKHLPENGTVGILGLSYKPDTNVIEESPGAILASMLADEKIKVAAYDPSGVEIRCIPPIWFADSMRACIEIADVVIITTMWDEFHGTETLFNNQVVIDCWRILDAQLLDDSVTYVPVGVGAAK